MSSLQLNPNRIIEISHFGRFYVLGAPKYVTLFVPDFVNKAREGWIIIEESSIVGMAPHMLNCLFRIPNKGDKLIPVLIKNQEMAEEICFACNRVK